jgi:hypothetical protein
MLFLPGYTSRVFLSDFILCRVRASVRIAGGAIFCIRTARTAALFTVFDKIGGNCAHKKNERGDDNRIRGFHRLSFTT